MRGPAGARQLRADSLRTTLLEHVLLQLLLCQLCPAFTEERQVWLARLKPPGPGGLKLWGGWKKGRDWKLGGLRDGNLSFHL